MNFELYSKAKILFVVQNCPFCMIWKESIDMINANLPLNKRIKIIDCTRYHDLAICEDTLIHSFSKEVNGAYPILFYEGQKIVGANTKSELIAVLDILLEDYYIRKKYNPYKFDKDCKIVKSFGGTKLLCT